MSGAKVNIVIDLDSLEMRVFPVAQTEDAILDGLPRGLSSESTVGQILRLLLAAGELNRPDGLYRTPDFPNELWSRLRDQAHTGGTRAR